MVSDLLDLSRIETGRLELNVRAISAMETVREVVETFDPLARGKNILLSASAMADDPTVLADGDKLHQVLTNLVHNAIKFTPPDGHIVLELQPDSDPFVRFCVTDSGIGVPAGEIDRIFEKFYRGESVPLEARGAGLGLAITKTLVELHGGRIWLESPASGGSRFIFTIPVASAPEPPLTSSVGPSRTLEAPSES
jgi:signal transduction histidine kinase